MTKFNIVTVIILTGLSLFTGTYLMAQHAKTNNAKKEQLKSSQASYEKYVDDNMDAHLKEFVELVSIPSISSIQTRC
jgi:flagellar biosynthesis protein FliP